MTEKIEWYKEVLELEPNSKVFFPLARLLVEEDRRDEAIAVLERGLDRHKEYLEARLLLIELLFQSGRMTECDREISDLSKVLTSYAGFWRAWAACLSSSQTEEASALKFLAAQFLCGPISLREALDKGVEAIVAERDERKDRDIIVELNNDVLKASEPAAARNQNDLHDISVASVNFEHDKNTITSSDMTVAEPLQNHSRETINEEFVADIKEDPSRPELESFHETDGARGSAITGQSSSGAERENGAPASPAGVYDLETGEKTGYNIEQEENDEDDAREEHFAIRTRSMADVLASQGDFDGAIDIYRELAATASPDEKEELQGRIVSLEERKKNESASQDAPVSKEKLINILEALAQRVEERVNNPADL